MRTFFHREAVQGLAIVVLFPVGLYLLLHNQGTAGLVCIGVTCLLFIGSYLRPRSSLRVKDVVERAIVPDQDTCSVGDDEWSKLFNGRAELRVRFQSLPPGLQRKIVSPEYRMIVMNTLAELGLGSTVGVVHERIARVLVGLDSEKSVHNFLLSGGYVPAERIKTCMKTLDTTLLTPVKEDIMRGISS